MDVSLSLLVAPANGPAFRLSCGNLLFVIATEIYRGYLSKTLQIGFVDAFEIDEVAAYLDPIGNTLNRSTYASPAEQLP